jgi:hypothetical protein
MEGGGSGSGFRGNRSPRQKSRGGGSKGCRGGRTLAQDMTALE